MAANSVKMARDGKFADVHPDEVANYSGGGWSHAHEPHEPKEVIINNNSGMSVETEQREVGGEEIIAVTIGAVNEAIKGGTFDAALADKLAPSPIEAGNNDELSDSELRKAIAEATGSTPGPNTKRETLLSRYNEISAASDA